VHHDTNYPTNTGSVNACGFALWQPIYAGHGIPTFPLKADKSPAVKNWGKMGLPASRQLATRKEFAETQGFGFVCGKRTKITALDIDYTDEKILADRLARHGQTPVIARTASGKFHGYYRHNGEKRWCRAWGQKAEDPKIDIIGAGVLIAPGSRTPKGTYEFIQGGLDDLDRLPVIRGIDDILAKKDKLVLPIPDGVFSHESPEPDDKPIPEGNRNTTIWRHCMANARKCGNVREVLMLATQFYVNHCDKHPPMSQEELMTTAASAWRHTEQGANFFINPTACFATSEFEDMPLTDPDAWRLLGYLKMKNGHYSEFLVSNGLAVSFKWSRQRLAATRKRLVDGGHITLTRAPTSYTGPALYRWGKA
jgi:hypothetical protein